MARKHGPLLIEERPARETSRRSWPVAVKPPATQVRSSAAWYQSPGAVVALLPEESPGRLRVSGAPGSGASGSGAPGWGRRGRRDRGRRAPAGPASDGTTAPAAGVDVPGAVVPGVVAGGKGL